MAEMSKAYTPEFMGDPNPREKILKLARKITDCVDHKILGVTVNDPEYWGLACVVTDEMADVALKMKVRHHYTFEDLLAKNPELGKEKLQKLLDDMSRIGILEYDYGDNYDHNGPIKGAKKIRRYTLPMFVPGSAEFTNMIKKQLDDHPELAMFFERMTYLPLTMVTPMVPPGGAGIGMHVIPVEKAIEMENGTMDIEHISYWLKKYEGHLGVGICSCRYGRAKLGEGCGDSCEEWCIGIGDMADYCRETGKGRDITYDEAMQILKNAEKNGFVHQITNIDGENKIFAICNCNVNICNALRTSQLFNTPNMSRSAYVARVEKDKCVACGKCVEYCPAGAVKLGQKLCTKQGEIKYPKHELPDNLSWGPDKWDEDYRDNNRINCYETGTSPCKVACPAHIAVQGYIRKAKEGKYREALELIKKDNPFPAICGRVCNKRCEAACTRGTIDEAVAIDDIKKFIAEQDLHAETRFVPEVVIPSNVDKQWSEKIAIIGAGPAGLSCAYYLATKGYKPTVFEKNARPGGMLTYGIPSYKLEKDVIEAEIDVLRELGVEIKCGVNVGTDVTIDELRKQGYKAFYVAIGCQGGRLPGIPGEDAIGTDMAVSFLHDATENHDRKLVGKTVVIGGGNVAMDVALTAKRLGAKTVKLVCLEQREEMPASAEEVAMAEEEGVQIYNGWGLGAVTTDENGKVSGLRAKRCLAVRDEKGRFNPQYDESDTMLLDSDFIILATGQRVDVGFLGKLAEQMKTPRGLIDADVESGKTPASRYYAGGDAVTGPNLAIRAIRAGRSAAQSILRDLGTQSESSNEKAERFTRFDVAGIEETKAHHLAMKPATERTLTDEDEASLDMQTAADEAKRCLHCACYAVSPSDITPVLVMLGAQIVTTERTLSAKALFTTKLTVQQVLHRGELVKEIRVPKAKGENHYDKRRVRDAIDFAIVSLASDMKTENGVIQEARLVMGGVAPVPYELPEVEAYLIGKEPTPETATQAGEIAMKNAFAMSKNEYKIFMAKDVIYNSIMRLK